MQILKNITFAICLFIAGCVSNSMAMEIPIYDFPIQAYSQKAEDHLSKDMEGYNKSLLSPDYQSSLLKQFYKHYYSSDAKGLSPWSAQMVVSVLPLMKKNIPEILAGFDSLENKHYALNFKEKNSNWLQKIRENMDLNALAASGYQEEKRAISIANTHARTLPDMAPDFFHASLPGQGFPFDNLQESAIWAGTPLYVFGETKDKAWALVLTPDAYFAWVKANDVAYVSSGFINTWQKAAQHRLVAVTQTEASIKDDRQQFQFTGYIGAVFPMIEADAEQTYILIPIKNNNQAIIKKGMVQTKSCSLMPLTASPKNMVKIFNQLKNRPYGWGGAFFFNDCSQEMKSIFTPFGIWLPRNSAAQAELSSTLDLSKNNLDERINFLKENGHPLMTLIYIGGHVMLYIGNNKTPMTYQNIWGLSPPARDKRYVIGQSLFLPLLKSYPENPELASLAGKSIFKLVYLDELNNTNDSPQGFVKRFLEQPNCCSHPYEDYLDFE